MTTHTINRHQKVEFSYLQAEELKTLRVYIEKLTALSTAIAAEFSKTGDLGKIQAEIDNTARKIIELELLKIKAELKFEISK
jgi:hypothetical protein